MKQKEWIKIFVEERDAVVQTFDIDKFKEFYAKWKARGFYDIDLPSDEIVEISLRKMAYHSTKIPENVRKKAEKWLLDRGYTTDMY